MATYSADEVLGAPPKTYSLDDILPGSKEPPKAKPQKYSVDEILSAKPDITPSSLLPSAADRQVARDTLTKQGLLGDENKSLADRVIERVIKAAIPNPNAPIEQSKVTAPTGMGSVGGMALPFQEGEFHPFTALEAGAKVGANVFNAMWTTISDGLAGIAGVTWSLATDDSLDRAVDRAPDKVVDTVVNKVVNKAVDMGVQFQRENQAARAKMVQYGKALMRVNETTVFQPLDERAAKESGTIAALEPSTEGEKALMDLAALMPMEFAQAGDAVNEAVLSTGKTLGINDRAAQVVGAILGSGVQASQVLVGLRPAVSYVGLTWWDKVLARAEEQKPFKPAPEVSGKVDEAARKVDNAFKELAVEKPEAIKLLTQQIAEIDPEYAGELDQRAQAAQELSARDQKILGHDIADATIRGKDLPRFPGTMIQLPGLPPGVTPPVRETKRLVSPEVFEAGVAAAAREVHESVGGGTPSSMPAVIPPPPVKTEKLPIWMHAPDANGMHPGGVMTTNMWSKAKDDNLQKYDNKEIDLDTYKIENQKLDQAYFGNLLHDANQPPKPVRYPQFTDETPWTIYNPTHGHEQKLADKMLEDGQLTVGEWERESIYLQKKYGPVLWRQWTTVSLSPSPPKAVEAGLAVYENLEEVGDKLGSNPGGKYRSPDGVEYYVKFYSNPLQGHTEALAARLYEMLGVDTPKPRMAQINGQVGLVTVWQNYKSIPKAVLTGSLEFSEPQLLDLARMYAMAVLTKNWDVVGLDFDNIVKSPIGHLVAVDTGGSFEFRAQGAPKEYTPDIQEAGSLLNPKLPSGQVFRPLFKMFPGLLDKVKYDVAGLNAIEARDAFKESKLPNWESLYQTFLTRRQLLLDKLESEQIHPDKWELLAKEEKKGFGPSEVQKDLFHGKPFTITKTQAKELFSKVNPPVNAKGKPLKKGPVILNSIGQPVHDSVKAMENFRKWATSNPNLSVMTNGKGEPLVLFRTQDKLTPILAANKNDHVKAAAESTSIYPFLSFTTDPKFWSGDYVYPCYVLVSQVGDFRNPEDVKKVIEWYKKQGHADVNGIKAGNYVPWENTDLWDAMGWDGIFMKESPGSATLNFATRLDGGHIKSALYNEGTYDIKDHSLIKVEETHYPTWVEQTIAQEEFVKFSKSLPASFYTQLDDAYHNGGWVSTHKVLRDFMRIDSPYRRVFEDMLNLVDDVHIYPVMDNDQLTPANTRLGEGAAAIYDPPTHSIAIRIAPQDILHMPYRLWHEIYHAGTVIFIRENPRHPLVVRLKSLHTLAGDRMDKLMAELRRFNVPIMSKYERLDAKEIDHTTHEASGPFYGISNILEFIVEANVNPVFQKLLIMSEKFRRANDGLRMMVSDSVDTTAKMFDVRDEDIPLLRALISLGRDILRAQADYMKVRNAPARKGTTLAVKDLNAGIPINTEGIKKAFEFLKQQAEKTDAGKIAVGKMEEYYERALKTYAPEALGIEARKAAAIVSKNFFIQSHKEMQIWGQAKVRRAYWLTQGTLKMAEFIKGFELGKSFDNPTWNAAAKGYRAWLEAIRLQDIRNGIIYDPAENYLPHMFKNIEKVRNYFLDKYGTKWGDPSFTKEKHFQLYEEAIAAGFEPRYTNPEDIILARQKASDIAETRVNILNQLEKWGVAVKVNKGDTLPPKGFPANKRRSPNGQYFWVHNVADAVLYNAFDSYSLWADTDVPGQLFRGYMGIKNTVVPVKLMISLFHPLHVIHIDNTAGITRGLKGFMGHPSIESFGKMLSALATANPGSALYKAIWEHRKEGARLFNMFKGIIPESEWTPEDRKSWQYLTESGMIPTRPIEEISGAIQKFRDAVKEQSNLRAAWHVPTAIISALQHPIFSVWIPELKIASLMKDIQLAMKLDPSLVEDAQRRGLMFRKLAKRVEARYGEMNYNTLFMNKLVKDLGVGLSLSLGWQLGLIDQFGGAAVDLVKLGLNPTNIREKVVSGNLDRPLNAMIYIATAMALCALMTYFFTGEPPKDMLDYTHPRTGEKDADGKDVRVNTMFYSREFMALYKHSEAKGWETGTLDFVKAKGSGIMDMVSTGFSGIDSLGREIRRPDDPLVKQTEETLGWLFADLDPISLEAIKKSTGSAKDIALAVTGFTPAGKYITDTKLEGQIKEAYSKYVNPQQVSFDKAQYSQDMKEVRQLYSQDKDYSDKMDQIQTKYGLDDKQMVMLEKGLDKEALPPTVRMFQGLEWGIQKKFLRQMTPEERDQYLPHLSKRHQAEWEDEE